MMLESDFWVSPDISNAVAKVKPII